MFTNGNGQINMNSDFGMCIYNICLNNDIKNIFEVGTWNGQGSTVCVMNAIINKQDSILYSIEANNDMFKLSVDFWKKYNTKNKLVLINGSLHNKIVDLKELNIIYNNVIPYYNEHYIPENNLLKISNIVNIDNINNIDVIILDGGEYTTQGDYEILMQKEPKFICLDDVNVYKCKNIRSQLLNDSKWELYKENLNQRNGWSVFKKLH